MLFEFFFVGRGATSKSEAPSPGDQQEQKNSWAGVRLSILVHNIFVFCNLLISNLGRVGGDLQEKTNGL